MQDSFVREVGVHWGFTTIENMMKFKQQKWRKLFETSNKPKWRSCYELFCGRSENGKSQKHLIEKYRPVPPYDEGGQNEMRI